MLMRRSTVMLSLAASAWGALMSPSRSTAGEIDPATPTDPRPSVIFVLTDDLAWNLVPYMPQVLQMQREGVTFTNYFVTDSLCCPSRASIFTGLLPHNTGVLANTGLQGGYRAFNQNDNESRSFAVALQNAGIAAAMIGKYLNGYHPDRDGVPVGWTEWNGVGWGYGGFDYTINRNGQLVNYGHEPDDYFTDVASRAALSFIERHASEPYFLEISTFAPHAPYTPAPRDRTTFLDVSAPRTPAFGWQPDEKDNAPEWLKRVPALTARDEALLDREFRKRVQAVQAIDRLIGEVRALLRAQGATNTYLIFSSDNGLHLGDWSLRAGKMTPFDTDIRVPLIVVGPGVAAGATVDSIVENIDLCPTFTELAGATPSTPPDGRSLVSLFDGVAPKSWRQAALIEHQRPESDRDDPDVAEPSAGNPPSYAALRFEDALYVEYDDVRQTRSYYDLVHDPYELHNIVDQLDPDRLDQLHQRLEANKSCRGSDDCWRAQSVRP